MLPDLKINIGDWFIADIIGNGIYEMVDNGINSGNRKYAIVRLKKLFGIEVDNIVRNHETTCHPIDIAKWNDFKILKQTK